MVFVCSGAKEIVVGSQVRGVECTFKMASMRFECKKVGSHPGICFGARRSFCNDWSVFIQDRVKSVEIRINEVR